MKDKRPISEQVAELTPEQISKTKKTFWILTPSCIVAMLLCFACLLALFGTFFATDVAYANYGKVPTLNIEEKAEAWDNYQNVQKDCETLSTVLIAAMFVIVATIAVVNIVISKKLPYYSDRKAIYIIKNKI